MIGADGTAVTPKQYLRNVLAFLDGPTLAHPEIFIQALRMGCLTRPAISAQTVNNSCRTGWTRMLMGKETHRLMQ